MPDLLSEPRPLQGKGEVTVKVADGIAHFPLTLEADAAADLIAAWRGR